MKKIYIQLTNRSDVELLVEMLYAKLGKTVRASLTEGYDGFESFTVREVEPEVVRVLDIGV